MWLKALSKRTPRAYFFYFVVVLLLLVIPYLKDFLNLLSSSSDYSPEENFWSSHALFFIPIAGFLLSLLVNRVFIVSDTFNRNTLWPGYLSTLLIVAIGNQFSLFNLLTHGVLGILIVSELLKIQYNRPVKHFCYNVGLYLGLAIMLQTNFLLIVPIVLYALVNLKPLNFKEYMLYFLGLLTPIYFLYAYCFLISDFTIWTKITMTIPDWFQLAETIKVGLVIQWIVVLISLIIVLMSTLFNFNSLAVAIRRKVVALLFLLGGTIIVGFSNQFNGLIIFYIAPTFAFFSTMLMLRYTNRPVIEVIHFIFVLLIISLQLVNDYLL